MYLRVPLSPDLQVLDVSNVYDFYSAWTEGKWDLMEYDIQLVITRRNFEVYIQQNH